MTNILLVVLLALATILSGLAILGKRPRVMLLGWFSSGLILSLYFLVLGFELLAAANALFVVASSTVLRLYSSLYGTKKIADAEREVTRGDWIHATGTFLVLAAILGFAASEMPATSGPNAELSANDFTLIFLRDFPELSAVVGFILFLMVVVAAAIGRPSWIRNSTRTLPTHEKRQS